jgi:hypothetical protein
MATNDKTARPLQEWLMDLKKHTGTKPSFVTLDDSAIELYAVEGAFGTMDTRTLLCQWHVSKAWRKQAMSCVVRVNTATEDTATTGVTAADNGEATTTLATATTAGVVAAVKKVTRAKKKMTDLDNNIDKKTRYPRSNRKKRKRIGPFDSVIPIDTNGDDEDAANDEYIRAASAQDAKRMAKLVAIDDVMRQLKDLMYETSIPIVEAKLEEYSSIWKIRQPAFWRYFNNHWLKDNKKTRWMKAHRYRIYHGTMDTNNYVESWHNVLKQKFLRRQFNIRLDQLIYVLRYTVIEYYQRETDNRYLAAGRMSKAERDLRRVEVLVEEMMARGTLHPLVSVGMEGYLVKSFETDGVVYTIFVVDQEIQRCSCPHNWDRKAVCKHMYAVLLLSDRSLQLTNNPKFVNMADPDPVEIENPSIEVGVVDNNKERIAARGRKTKSDMAAALKVIMNGYHDLDSKIGDATTDEQADANDARAQEWIASIGVFKMEISTSGVKKRKTQQEQQGW